MVETEVFRNEERYLSGESLSTFPNDASLEVEMRELYDRLVGSGRRVVERYISIFYLQGKGPIRSLKSALRRKNFFMKDNIPRYQIAELALENLSNSAPDF